MTRLLLICVTLGGVATAVSLSRIPAMGLQPVFLLHGGAYLMALLVTIFRRRLPVGLVKSTVVGSILAIGFATLSHTGAGGSGLLHVSVAIAIASVFFGLRVGLLLLAFVATLFLSYGWAISQGIVVLSLDLGAYFMQFGAFVQMGTSLVFFVLILLLLIHETTRRLEAQVQLQKRTTAQLQQEIHERKLSEAERERVDHLHRTLLESIPFTSWIRDLDDQTIRFLSDNSGEILGLSPAQPENNLFDPERIHPDNQGAVKNFLEKAQSGLLPISVKYRWKREGRWVWIFNQAIDSFEYEGHPALFGLASDVSARVEQEERDRQADRLEAIGKLAGGIAHDFNNQLAGIQGMAELMRLQTSDPLHGEMLDDILRATQHGAKLTTQLLTFSRRQPLEKQWLDFHLLIQESVRFLQRGLGPSVRFQVELNASQTQVEGVASLLDSVLANISINARDAMGGNGTLRITTDNRPHPTPPPSDPPVENWLCVEVSDDGPGVPTEIRHRIFEPFFTTKGPGKGSGMGLPLVYGTIRDHGGTIAIDTPEGGKGALFRIFLPVRPTIATTPAAIAPSSNSTPARVLRLWVADDEEAPRKATARMLSSLGHDVRHFPSGQDLLDAFASDSDRPDMVLLDLVMPHPDGAATFQQLLELDPSLPVAFYSGYDPDDRVHQLLRSGAAGFLRKPFRLEELRGMTEHMMRRLPPH